MSYVPLNIKTEYDLMNSLIKIDDLILYAKNHNINALGITDSTLFGSYEFIQKCNQNNIKPIIGCPFEIDNKSFIVYPKDYDGLCYLFNLVSKRNISNNLSFDDFINNDKFIFVCDYSTYDFLSTKFNNLYISYSSFDEVKNIENITKYYVNMNLIRYFDSSSYEDFKYLKYISLSKTIDEELQCEKSHFVISNNTIDIKSTVDFASLINIIIPQKKLHIPKYNDNSVSFLRALAKKGLEKRMSGNVPLEYKNRLTYELSTIEKMNFTDYFLIVYDFVLFAKKHNILVGPGRGSGAGSLVNYALGIINIDPLKYDLIFERFLNPQRITMPDIDIDFDSEKREEVIDYVTSKYGKYNTARIISFNTMLPKQIIRDVARTLKLNQLLVDNICKTIKDEKTFDELENNYEFKKITKNNNETNILLKVCKNLCGFKKNTSIHAAGVVISDQELYKFMPLYKSNDVILTGYSMEHIEDIGLLKMDFLSIKNLNTISNIVKDINDSGISFNIDNIDLNDNRTLYLFKKAYTSGIFQFESNGMKSFLRKLQVDNFNTLTDAIALYRPGPRDMIDEYINRKNKKVKITYLIDELKPILQSTYGIIIYQEQVLDILRKIGGFSYAEADIIRRAMSKKKEKEILENKEIFIERVSKKNIDKNICEKLYNMIIKFASYGFNKSHSVVYSLVAFQMAYLKINYSLYFMKNLLNMNKSSDKLKEYIDESRILNIDFLNIDINLSDKEFIIKDNHLVIPFTIIKSIAAIVSDEIVIERQNGLFKDFYDFMIRCYGKTVNKRVIVSLIESGAFNSFNINKKQTIGNIDEIINYVSLCKDLNVIIDEKPTFDICDDYNDKEIIDNEVKNYGFYLSFHPTVKYDRSNFVGLNYIVKYFNKTITCIVYVESIKTIKTKNNDKMSFVLLSDEYSSIEGIIFPNTYKTIGIIQKNNVYKINGKVEKNNSDYQLIIYNMIKL